MKSNPPQVLKLGKSFGTFTLDGKTCEYCWDPESIGYSDNMNLKECLVDPTQACWLEHFGVGVCNGKFFTDKKSWNAEFRNGKLNSAAA